MIRHKSSDIHYWADYNFSTYISAEDEEMIFITKTPVVKKYDFNRKQGIRILRIT
jgi:hypothetical protein